MRILSKRQKKKGTGVWELRNLWMSDWVGFWNGETMGWLIEHSLWFGSRCLTSGFSSIKKDRNLLLFLTWLTFVSSRLSSKSLMKSSITYQIITQKAKLSILTQSWYPPKHHWCITTHKQLKQDFHYHVVNYIPTMFKLISSHVLAKEYILYVCTFSKYLFFIKNQIGKVLFSSCKIRNKNTEDV